MRTFGPLRWPGALVCVSLAASAVAADATATADDADGDQSLPGVTVTGHREQESDREAFPATSASVSQEQMQATVNSIDVEDAAKYLPSIFIRKRNYGDTQPVIATRNWGVNSSARTLVYVDDIPISALIANNNTLGLPASGWCHPSRSSASTCCMDPTRVSIRVTRWEA
jgi:iron complex outermembrane recepter protein